MARIRRIVFPMILSEDAFLLILSDFLRFFYFSPNFPCPDFAF